MTGPASRMKDPTTAEGLLAAVQSGAELVGSAFDQPDDDWLPVFFATIDGTMQAFGLLATIDDPEMRAAMVGALVADLPSVPQAAAMVWSVWTYAPGRRDEAIEAVLIQAADRSQYKVAMAQIVRRAEAPPLLRQWNPMPGDELAGPLVAVLRQAVGQP